MGRTAERLCAALALACLAICSGCGRAETVASGVCRMVVETESDFPWRPSLQLDAEQGTFIFNFDTLSSDLCVGSYTVKNGVLTCKTDDGLYQYLFERTGESTLAFRQE